MQRDVAAVVGERQDGWVFHARQQRDHRFDFVFGCVQHDVFGLARLRHALDTGEQPRCQRLGFCGKRAGALYQAGIRAVYGFHFAQAVGFQRRPR